MKQELKSFQPLLSLLLLCMSRQSVNAIFSTSGFVAHLFSVHLLTIVVTPQVSRVILLPRHVVW